MRKMLGIAAAATATAAMVLYAAPADADTPDFSGCESVPIFGLNPQIRKICDDPFYADGSWARYRQFVHPTYVHSSCGGVYYQGGNCPPWMAQDTIPGVIGEVETYVITADTVPPGEPGHLDNPIRCTGTAMRCD